MGNPFRTDYPAVSNAAKEDGKLSPRLARHRPAYKGISRIDSEESHTHGWYVRIRRDGKVKSRFFSDRKYGGVAKALMKARRHYKQEMKRLIKDTLGEAPKRVPERVIVTRNRHNNTGVIGVQRVERKNPGGSVYRAFRVCWTEENGRARTRFFSINKLGEKEAFQRACEHRREKLLAV